jgi:hypothetical protein
MQSILLWKAHSEKMPYYAILYNKKIAHIFSLNFFARHYQQCLTALRSYACNDAGSRPGKNCMRGRFSGKTLKLFDSYTEKFISARLGHREMVFFNCCKFFLSSHLTEEGRSLFFNKKTGTMRHARHPDLQWQVPSRLKTTAVPTTLLSTRIFVDAEIVFRTDCHEALILLRVIFGFIFFRRIPFEKSE